MTRPRISVVVPTYRRPALLGDCLGSLARQAAPPCEFEVIVVDDGSGDETSAVLAAAASKLGNLRTIPLERNGGPARARNRGVAAASAGLVLFLDDDIVAPPSLVGAHLALHNQGEERLGVLGLVSWAPWLRVTPFMRWLDRSGLQFAYDTWLTPGPVNPPYAAFYTANLSMRRSLFEEAGGFDERFPYPAYEDMELAWRLHQRGFRLEYHPEAHAHHSRAMALGPYCDRMARVAESAVLLRSLQPGFPLEEVPQHWRRRRRTRHALRLAAPLARVARANSLLERHYQAEIAAAAAAGRARGAATLASRLSGSR